MEIATMATAALLSSFNTAGDAAAASFWGVPTPFLPSLCFSSHVAYSPFISLPRPSSIRRLSVSRKKFGIGAVPEAIEAVNAPELNSELLKVVPEPVEAQIAAREEAKGENVFAVVVIGSRQYIVFPGRFIYTQRLKGANVNDKIILNQVLLVGTRTKTYIGQPIVTNAAVHAVVEEQGLDDKVIVFKYKKKKNYKRTIGHRQPNTKIRILGITGFLDFPAETLEEKDLL